MNPDISTIDERKAQIRDVYNKIGSSNTIVISGGGAIGSELAADLKLRNTDKRYTQSLLIGVLRLLHNF